MNLVLSMLMIAASSASVWAGITNPEGGMFAGLSRALRGEPAQRKASTSSASFLASFASLTGATPKSAGAVKPTSSTAPATSGSGYQLGPVKPWVKRAAQLIGPMFGITTVLGYGTRSNTTDHDDGLALDFMTSNPVTGTALAAYVLANRKRLGVTYVIWRQRINSGDGRGWRAMEDRGSPTANHMDHVHVSFTRTDPRGGTT